MVDEMGPHMATITHTAPLIAADLPPRLQPSHLWLVCVFVCVCVCLCVTRGIPGSGGQNVHIDAYFATLTHPLTHTHTNTHISLLCFEHFRQNFPQINKYVITYINKHSTPPSQLSPLQSVKYCLRPTCIWLCWWKVKKAGSHFGCWRREKWRDGQRGKERERESQEGEKYWEIWGRVW